jgi:hypothetical protein
MAITVTQKVLTLDYWKLAGNIVAGDYVFNHEGKPVRVVSVHLYRPDNVVMVQFNDNVSICGDEKLKFGVEDIKYRKRVYEYKGTRRFKRPLKTLSTANLMRLNLKNDRRRLIYSVPTIKPLEFPTQFLPVPPFLFGYWYMNRRPNGSILVDDDIVAKYNAHGYVLHRGYKVPSGKREYFTEPDIAKQFFPMKVSAIPNNYLLSSIEQRIELLKGLIFGKPNQYNTQIDLFRITEMHYGTVLQIQGLVESLGNRSKLVYNEQLKNYTLTFRTRYKIIENQASPPIRVHNARRYITGIKPMLSEMCIHISTEDENGSIVVGEGFIPCH